MRGWENEVDINLQLHPHLIKQNSNTLFFIKKIVKFILLNEFKCLVTAFSLYYLFLKIIFYF